MRNEILKSFSTPIVAASFHESSNNRGSVLVKEKLS
jgi:hypothetical protein